MAKTCEPEETNDENHNNTAKDYFESFQKKLQTVEVEYETQFFKWLSILACLSSMGFVIKMAIESKVKDAAIAVVILLQIFLLGGVVFAFTERVAGLVMVIFFCACIFATTFSWTIWPVFCAVLSGLAYSVLLCIRDHKRSHPPAGESK